MMNVTAKSARRRRAGLLIALAASVALLVGVIGAAPAQAEFGIHDFDVTFANQDDSPATQAGSHPFAVNTSFGLNNTPGFPPSLDGELKELSVEQIAGLIGDATAYPTCSTADFLGLPEGVSIIEGKTECEESEVAVGVVGAWIWPIEAHLPVLNLEPAPGVPVRLGFNVAGAHIVINVGLKQGPDYNIIGAQKNVPQVVPFLAAKLQLWGNPADPAHDELRGECAIGGPEVFFESELTFDFSHGDGDTCPTNNPQRPLLTLPTSCVGPQATNWRADSWQEPAKSISGSVLTHDDAEPPNPQGFTGCGKLGFVPSIDSKATSDSAETGTGLDFSVDFNQEGLKSPNGLAQSVTEKAEVTLPEGMTINPSVGEGLGVCTPEDLGRETLESAPGEGCPNSSKVGTLHVEAPIVDEPVEGSIFLAQQDDPATSEPGAENPFDSLIALYFALKSPDLGVMVKLPVLVEPDPKTGQLIVTLDDIPQIPFNRFTAHMREGQRAPLVTPATCGAHTTVARLYPRSDPDNPRTVTSDFEITSGVGDGPCPPGGVPPFNPRFEAGSVNNNAGSFSPFNMRLLRSDGEQDMTKFSSILPPGELGSLAGVSKCPDASIEAAKAKTGREELAAPSCPANSQIGRTLAGAGVGSALTYVPGQVYLAGPYKGDPLSVVSITPAVAGPFDAGTVVIRLALTLNPKTAEVEVDGANSDPIPHIIKGIVLKARDLRVYVDRPNFTLNPTSCDESSARATLFGSFVDVFDPADDRPVDLATRFQAANCLNLGFKPRLNLNLKGGSKRGGHPGLSAIYRPRPGDANVEGLVVRLPRSAFLDQAHIRTICTRVQFAADNCPKAAQYGYIRAWTPLLDEPLQGPAWLRSSDHKLPDLVFDLHGIVDIEVSTRLDSARGGIRATLDEIPDAPLSLVVLRMQGGKKGLIVNSRDLCAKPSRANVEFSGHNGKRHDFNPVMRAQCGGKRKAKRAGQPRARVARSSAAG
jgi:hypothetical protein